MLVVCTTVRDQAYFNAACETLSTFMGQGKLSRSLRGKTMLERNVAKMSPFQVKCWKHASLVLQLAWALY